MGKKFYYALVLGLACVVVIGLAGRLEAKKYLFYDLGTLGGNEAAAYAINDQGQVAGWAENAAGKECAFRWTPGNPPQMENLGTLGGSESRAYGLNNAGQVVGEAVAPTYYSYAFFWSSKNMQNLGTLEGGEGSEAKGVNDAGKVVGSDWFILNNEAQNRPFWWTDGPVQPLLLPGGYVSGKANAINQTGQVVGYFKDILTTMTFACFWSSVHAVPQELGTFGGPYSFANDINDLGQVVGAAAMPGPMQRAFIWSLGKEKQELGTLGLEESVAYAINNRGEVIGEAFTIGKTSRRFYWTKETGILDLEEMVVNLPPNEFLLHVHDINNRGEIVGETWYGRAFLLRPIAGTVPTLQLLLLD